MRRRKLGRTDLEVSNLCLGTMQFGWTADEAESFAVLDAFVEAGGNFLDTADIYSNWAPGNPGGVSEALIGRWMRERGNRGGLVVATKVRGRMWEGPDGEGLSRAHVLRAAEESLRRLGVETIDLYQCHWPDEATPIEETLSALAELVGSGKVRYLGASNYDAAGLEAALSASADAGLPRFETLQPNHSLVRREFEAELMGLCVREGIGVIPYSPLAGGFLTGKYRKDGPPVASARAERVKRYMTPEGFATLAALEEVASARSAPMASVALAWQLSKPGVVAPIVGANTPAQLADLLPGADLDLSPDEITLLERAGAD